MTNFKDIRPAKFIVAVVFTIILVISLTLVHGLYENSLKAEIFNDARELEQKVWQAAAEEYRRLYLVTQTGQAILTVNDEEIRKDRIEGLGSYFGEEGQLTDLVFTAGFADFKQPGRQIFFDFRTEEWNETEYMLDKRALSRSLVIIDDDLDQERQLVFIVIKADEGDTVLLFQVDRMGFLESFLQPAIAAAFSGTWIEWINSEDDSALKDHKPGAGFEPSGYRFRPLRIITGLMNDQTPLMVPVPGFNDSRKIMGRGRFVPPGFDAESEPEDLKPEPDALMPFVADPEIFVSIRALDGAFYHETERKTAVSFLESALLLTVIIVSFLVLYFQFDKLRQLRKKEREFVASVTHELRTPLTVIQAAADNLSTGIVPAEKLKIYGNLIIEQSGRLGKMIEEILLFSKMEDRKAKPPEPVLIDFRSLIPDLRSTLEAIAAMAGVRLHWDVNSLPQEGRGDLQAFMLITENLVSNAAFHAYGKAGGLVRVRMKFSVPGSLQVIVEDDGRGIEPREARRIFEPFYRDNISRQRQEKGSGLGLFIAKRKAELAGGYLKLESPYLRIDGQKAEGCRFVMSLPCSIDLETENG